MTEILQKKGRRRKEDDHSLGRPSFFGSSFKKNTQTKKISRTKIKKMPKNGSNFDFQPLSPPKKYLCIIFGRKLLKMDFKPLF